MKLCILHAHSIWGGTPVERLIAHHIGKETAYDQLLSEVSHGASFDHLAFYEKFLSLLAGTSERALRDYIASLQKLPGVDEALTKLRLLGYKRIIVCESIPHTVSWLAPHVDAIIGPDISLQEGTVTGHSLRSPPHDYTALSPFIRSSPRDTVSVGTLEGDERFFPPHSHTIGFLARHNLWSKCSFLIIQKDLRNILRCLPEYFVDFSQMRVIEEVHASQGMPYLEMMGIVGSKSARFIEQCAPKRIFVVCGKGNNGGDGLSCAHVLSERKYSVVSYLPEPPKTTEALYYYTLVKNNRLFPLYEGSVDLSSCGPGDVVVDALVGTGGKGEAHGKLRDWIDAINRARKNGATIVSLDIPSGLYPNPSPDAPIVRAHYTLCIERVKTIVAQHPSYAGTIVPLRIFPYTPESL